MSQRAPLDDFDSWCHEAYDEIDAGLSAETSGQNEEARKRYLRGMDLIDQALGISLDSNGERWEKARINREKIKKTRGEVMKRVLDSDKPSLYPKTVSLERAMAAGVPSSPTVGRTPSPMSPTAEVDAQQLLFIPKGVQMFFITPPNKVEKPSKPSSLVIYKMKIDGQDKSFLKVDNWIYPLIPSKSPVLFSQDGYFVFPDLAEPESGKSIGIMLANDTPAEVKELLLTILKDLTALRDQVEVKPAEEEEKEEAGGAGSMIANGLIYGAEKVAQGIKWTAAVASTLLDKGTQQLTSQPRPERPSTELDPRVASGLRVAKNVGGTAVKVSGSLVNAVGKATMALGRAVAPTIEKHGSSLIKSATGKSTKEAEGTMDTVMEVASGAVKGFGTVFMGLEESAKLVADSARKNTVTVVSHRYGSQAAEATNDALKTMGYAAMTTYNVSNLGAKGVAKQAAKNTGKIILDNHAQKRAVKKGTKPQQLHAPLYPELQNGGKPEENNITEDNHAHEHKLSGKVKKPQQLHAPLYPEAQHSEDNISGDKTVAKK